jgi:chromosome segregation ATPase
MSNISGVPAYTPPPAPDYVSPVLQTIESQIGKVTDLYQDISAIMRQIAALEPPQHPIRGAHESDESWGGRMEQFNANTAKFQAELNRLNGQLRNVQDRLARAELVLQRLQNSDLPNAQRKQAHEIEDNLKKAQKALEDGVKAAEELSKSSSGKGTESGEEQKLELKAIQKKIEVEATLDGTSLKDLVSIFSLALVALQASPEKMNNPFIRVPTAAGSGLPPVSTP